MALSMNWFPNSNADINTINKCKQKISIERAKIADSEFNIQLYTDHMVSKIRNIIPVVSERVLRIVWNNINKDKKEEQYARCYKFLNDCIKENIIRDTQCVYKKTKLITEIVVNGYEAYAYSVHFFADKTEFIFTIPVPEHIYSDSYIYANEGMYDLAYRSSPSCLTSIALSYDLNDLYKAFKEFVENKEEN